MNRKYRISIAAILATVLVLTAVGAWAAPKFQGTVPPPATSGTGNSTTPINLGTVEVSTNCAACSMTATVVPNPGSSAPAPTGKQFLGTAFELSVVGTGPFNISFAYPTAFADKGAKIYKLSTAVTPNVWVEVPSVVNADGTISADVTEGGIYTLIGNS